MPNDSDKVLYRCPVCERTFRVPVELSGRSECVECRRAIEKRETERQAELRRRQGAAEAEAKLSRERQQTAATAEAQRQADALRSYSALEFLGIALSALAMLGMIVGAGFVLFVFTIPTPDGFRPREAFAAAIPGITLLSSSFGGFVAGHLIFLAINVAGDIERTKRTQDAVLKLLQSGAGTHQN